MAGRNFEPREPVQEIGGDHAQGWAAWEAAMMAKRGASQTGSKASSARLRREMLDMARESMACADMLGAVDGLGGSDKAWVLSQLWQEYVREFDLEKIKACEALGCKFPNKAVSDMAQGAGNPGKAGGQAWKDCFAYVLSKAGRGLGELDGQMAPLHQALAGNGLCAQGAAIAMLEMGADANLPTRSGRMPLELAIGSGKDLACVELAKRGGRVAMERSALCMAVAAGLPKLAEYLLGNGEDPERVDPVLGLCALDMEPGGSGGVKERLRETMAQASKGVLGALLKQECSSGGSSGKSRL